VASVTLKALANSSPGFALKPWEKGACLFRRNPEGVAMGLRWVCDQRAATQPLQGCAMRKMTFVIPGLPKLNPGLELANTFGVAQRCVSVSIISRRSPP